MSEVERIYCTGKKVGVKNMMKQSDWTLEGATVDHTKRV